MTGRVREEADLVVVGAGPAGLAAAIAARKAGVLRVEVLEREGQAGGVPRHSAHLGYGIRDLHRMLDGPSYARGYVARAMAAGVRLRTSTMVTGWSDDGGLELTSPARLSTLHAPAVLLATGARERSRAARWVPGDRGLGVYTTGQLQQAVQLHGQSIGRRAVVIGAEHVSFSAVVTLHHAGVEVAGLVTELARHQSYAAFGWGARLLFGAKVHARTKLVEVRGRPRVTGVVLQNLSDGTRRMLECDTVVFSGDWVPDHELVRTRGLDLDRGTLGPVVDACAMTSVDGVFAAGNLCHPVETADVAALGGRHAGDGIARWLAQRSRIASSAGVPLEVDDSLEWVSPQRLRTTFDVPARGRLLVRPRRFARLPEVVVSQGDRRLWQGRVAHFVPSRSAAVPTGWLAGVDPDGPPVRIATATGATSRGRGHPARTT